VRAIKVPEMSPATLRRSIRFEAAKHIDQASTGVAIENSAVEFDILGKSGRHMEVLLVVAPQPMVNGRVAVMEGAGLEPVAVDVEVFALLRTLEVAGHLPPAGQAAVVMNMGATYTDLNIVLGNRVAAPRSIPIGGNALTSSLASLMNLPIEEAEEHKRQIDVTPGRVGAGSPAPSGADPVRQVTLPFVDELCRELRRTVIFFMSQAAEAGMHVAVDQLILAGGGAQLAGLADYLSERLEMKIAMLDPLATQGRNGALERWAGRGPEFAVAVGLALKEYV